MYEKCYPNDSRVRDCIEVTKRYLKGEATKKELDAARAAAYAAARAAARATAARAYCATDAAYAAGAAMMQRIRDEFERLVTEALEKV